MAMLSPADPLMAEREDQFLCGSEILACPILNHEGTASPLLPPGWWRDFWTGERIEGGREIAVHHPLETFPVFVREGGIVPWRCHPVGWPPHTRISR